MISRPSRFQETVVKAKRCLVSTAWTSIYQVRFYSGSALSVSKITHTSPNFNNEINTNHEHLHVWPWQPCNHKMKLTMCTQRRACSTGALMWGGKALRVHWLVSPAYTCVEWVCASYSSQTGHSPSFLINHCPEWRVHLWHVSILTNAVTFLTVFWCFVLSSSITLVLWTTATCSCTQFFGTFSIWSFLIFPNEMRLTTTIVERYVGYCEWLELEWREDWEQWEVMSD